jgi:hypothetical protein
MEPHSAQRRIRKVRRDIYLDVGVVGTDRLAAFLAFARF